MDPTRATPQILVEPTLDQESVYPTIKELLALPAMAGVRLLTDPAVASQRRVRSASVQEGPLEDFVRPGELVMTTGIGLEEDEAALIRFATDIAAAGAAGLAIAVGRYLAEVPTALIAEAERIGLPVLGFRWAMRFSEVTELILGYIVERQNAWLRRSEEVHHLFTRIVLSGGDLPGLCRFIEELLGRPAQIANRWGESVDGGPSSLAGQAPPGWEVTAVRIPVAAERKPLGAILVAGGPEPMSEVDAQIASHAATAAALIMLMERAASDGEARGQTEFAAAVLSGPTVSARELERRSAALGIDAHQAFAVYHLSFASTRQISEADLSEVGRWAVQRAIDGRRVAALQSWDGADVTLVIPLGEATARTRGQQVIDHIVANVARHDPDTSVTSGIGAVAPDLAIVRDSFREAVTANRLGLVLHGAGSSTEYADLGAYPALYEALHAEGSRPAFAELQERYLGVATRYEAEFGLPLLETLAAYFSERGNVSATARELRINRQSLLYRLEKFELLSGVDLASPLDRFALELAVRCWRMNLGQMDAIGDLDADLN
jgi:purine catabolism regulator